MPLTKEQADTFGRCTDRFFDGLNAQAQSDPALGLTVNDKPYRLCFRHDRRDMVFGVSQRAPIGQRWPNGQKWKTYDGPTWQDCELIAQTAQSDEEVIKSFHDIAFNGYKPMRTRGGALLNEKAIEELVERRVRDLLQQKLNEIVQKQSQQSETVPETDLKVKTKIAGRDFTATATKVTVPVVPPKDLELWTERARMLGMSPPKIDSMGRFHGRWLGEARAKWKEHQKRSTETQQDLSEPGFAPA